MASDKTATNVTTTKGLTLQERSPAWNTARPFVIGGFSASLATCCIQPLDMVKVRIQLQGQGGSGGINTNPLSVAKNLIKEEGFLGLYTGLSAGVTRQLTYGLSRLGLFRTLTNKFTPEGGTAADIPFLTKVACSLTAGGIGAFIGTPADAALVRMQADATLPAERRRGYTSVFNALRRMIAEEGITGFFTGASPTIARGLLINVGMLTTYDSFKQHLGGYLGGYDSQTNRFACGFLSGWVAATMSLPADFIKTRLQKQVPDSDGKLPYKGVFDAFYKVIKQEGFLALYQGYPTFVIRITPHIMLTWVFMDNASAFMKKFNM